MKNQHKEDQFWSLCTTMNLKCIRLLRHIQKSNSIDGVIEFNGTIAAQDTIQGIKDMNSGGHSLFLLTGFRDNVNDIASLYLGLTLPVMEHYHGAQVRTAYGLISGIDISLG